MMIGKWYQQSFSDKTIYFLVQRRQKNGGYAGIQVDHYLGSFAKPKVKSASVPNSAHFLNLWKAVEDIPAVVKSVLSGKVLIVE